MARRFCGTINIYITYNDDDTYSGSIVVNKVRWPFRNLRAPAIGFKHAYDSPEAYDKMANSAISFADAVNAIDHETGAWMSDGKYSISRKK